MDAVTGTEYLQKEVCQLVCGILSVFGKNSAEGDVVASVLAELQKKPYCDVLAADL